uniref:Uncharacterized protein n=1 Tax=Anguilla anguilla TaxID=7936 RepID=A0A0E9PP41_ANGAN
MLCIGNEEVNIVWINQSKEKAAHRLLNLSLLFGNIFIFSLVLYGGLA